MAQAEVCKTLYAGSIPAAASMNPGDGRPPDFVHDPSALPPEQYADFMRERFEATPLHGLLGIELEPFDVSGEAGVVVARMPVAPGAFNASGNLHGGAIATLIDVAAGACAAANSPEFSPGETTIVTADLHVRYLGRPKGELVRAVARVMRAGRQLTVIECEVRDELDNLIAVSDFASMVVPLRHPLPLARGGDHRNPDI